MAKRGRPSGYDPKYIDMVDKYLNEQKDIYVKKGKEEKIQVNLPTVNGFCLYAWIPESTLYDWKKEHEDFSESLRKIVKEQEKRLLNMWLSWEYNSTIAKLILSANHGMTERKDITSDGKRVSIAELTFDEDEEE